MASRKDEKEQRRQERLEAEQAESSQAARQRMFAIIGGVALVAVVVVVALIVISQSGGGGGGNANDITTNSTVDLVDGLDQNGTVLGDPNAKAKIVEFGDLQCPACKAFSDKSIPELLSGPVTAGDAQIEFKNFIIIGPQSVDAAKAALAASEQGRYWQFIETFYANQGTENSGYVTDEFLTNVAKAAGVKDIDAWNTSRNSDKWTKQLQDIQKEASEKGFSSTPSLLVEGPGGTQVVGAAPSTGQVEDAIQKASGS